VAQRVLGRAVTLCDKVFFNARASDGLMSIEGLTDSWFQNVRRTILIVDMVESVRLMERDERGTVLHWRKLVEHTENDLLFGRPGRMVKSLGDGMLLELDTVPAALAVAFGMQAEARLLNEGMSPGSQVHLRVGLEVGDLMADAHDIYGHNVNIAARLTTLAEPGEIVASCRVRDLIVDRVDAEVEDLGECFLKHVRKPVRAYRLTPPGQGGVRTRMAATTQPMLPTIAVIPLRSPVPGQPVSALGQIVAEELIRAFGQSPHLHVISRLSTAAFASGDHTLESIADLLGASHVMTGTAFDDGDTLRLSLELTEVRSKHTLWSETSREKVGSVLLGDQELVARVASEVGMAILNRELQRARSLPVRTLESYTLLLAAVNAMYRLSAKDFLYASKMLDSAIERNPRHSVPRAWLGQWHILKAQQGWSDDAGQEQRLARDHTSRALDLNPDCEHAMTLDGLAKTQLAQDLDSAEAQFDRSLQLNPNNAYTHLLKGTIHSFRGEGPEAAAACERGMSHSPFDPQKYLYDCLTAVAYLIAGDYPKSIELARQSLKANSTHTSTIRTLAVAQAALGQEEAARETVAKLTALEPGFSVSGWEASSPAAKYELMV